MEQKILKLNEAEFIAQGCHQKCYAHPENKELCVKILNKINPREIRQLKREINYLVKLQKKYPEVSNIAKYYGCVNTDLGTGYVYDLVKDYDGKISQSLESLLQRESFLEENFSQVVQALKELKESMFKYEIITMDLYPENIMYKRISEDEVELVIIDDVGTAVLIPLEYFFTFAAQGRIKRKWKALVNSLRERIEKPLIQEVIKEIK